MKRFLASLVFFNFSSLACMAMADTPVITVAVDTFKTKIDGYLQTPLGGQPGTTNDKRPTLDELDIDHAQVTRLYSSAQWQELKIYLQYQPTNFSGHATLQQDLLTHNIIFPAGDEVHSDISIDWKQSGAGWLLLFDDGKMKITPQLELMLIDFNYHLNDNTQSTDRNYTKTMLRSGLDIHYQYNRYISFLFQGMTSIPTSQSTPELMDISAGCEFNLQPEAKTFQPLLLIGIGKQQLDFADQQTVSNHIYLDTKLFFSSGLVLRF